MLSPHSHLRTLKEIERDCIPGLVEVLQTEGTESVRYHYRLVPRLRSCVWHNRATAEQKREGWEMRVRIGKIIVKVLHEVHERRVEEAIRPLKDGPEKFYRAGG